MADQIRGIKHVSVYSRPERKADAKISSKESLMLEQARTSLTVVAAGMRLHSIFDIWGAGLMRTLRLCRSNPSGSPTFARHSPYLSRMSTCIFVTRSGSRIGKLSSDGIASFKRLHEGGSKTQEERKKQNFL
uniref:Uncharacterized protein n=1 Tax=Glossina pallidipes TaxID=7398 RepID=A0A1A9ZZK0_GLOPL